MDPKEIIASIWFNYAGDSLMINQIKANAIEEVWVSLGFNREDLAFEIISKLFK